MNSVVREFVSQHDAIDELPLITEEATVTTVEKMDQNRRNEVIAAIKDWLEEYGLAETYGELVGDSDLLPLHSALVRDGHLELARRCNLLAERYDRPKPMLARVEFETEEPIDFVAGQYLGLRYEDTPRAYSISSSPSRDNLEICVRRVPGGRLSPQICDDLQVGDEVTIRGPYGELVLKDPSERDIVFLATGTGVAPFKSMIDYLFETDLDRVNGTSRDIWLFLGAGWKDDLPYRKAFRRLQQSRENFHFIPCLSRELTLSDWDGETDYVQHALLKHTDPTTVRYGLGDRLEKWLQKHPQSGVQERLNAQSLEVYACGINAMVYSLVRMVQRLGVKDRFIESEGFG